MNTYLLMSMILINLIIPNNNMIEYKISSVTLKYKDLDLMIYYIQILLVAIHQDLYI